MIWRRTLLAAGLAFCAVHAFAGPQHVERAERPPANLVFLVDVSGSMKSADKLPLLVRSLKMLTQKLTRRDRISLVVYAGSSGVVLEPTPGSRKFDIIEALDDLVVGHPEFHRVGGTKPRHQ